MTRLALSPAFVGLRFVMVSMLRRLLTGEQIRCGSYRKFAIIALEKRVSAERSSPRIKMLKGILAKTRPQPIREPLPPLKHYDPPRMGGYRRR